MRSIFSLVFLMLSISAFSQKSAQEAFIPWSKLKNPVYYHQDWSVKDACMIKKDEYFYLFFSAFFYDTGRERSHVVAVRTVDFIHFSEPLFILAGIEDGWIGMCSPDISLIQGKYYLTYNSWGDKKDKPNQLFYAVSEDLESWDLNKPLATNLTKGKRAIDAAITVDNGEYYLVWKEEQTPQMARAKDLNSSDWKLLGRPAGERWFENAQFIDIDNEQQMLLTGSAHRPYLSKRIAANSSQNNWLEWGEFNRLEIPKQSFNTNNIANAAFLADWRQYDGFFYLLYAGRTESVSHKGRGDNKLGLARSKDLKNWEPLPEAKE